VRGRARWRPGSRRSARACCCSTCCWASSWACTRRTSTACSSGARAARSRGARASAPGPGRGCGLCPPEVLRLQHGQGPDATQALLSGTHSAGCLAGTPSTFCMQSGRHQAPKMFLGCTKARHPAGSRLGRAIALIRAILRRHCAGTATTCLARCSRARWRSSRRARRRAPPRPHTPPARPPARPRHPLGRAAAAPAWAARPGAPASARRAAAVRSLRHATCWLKR